MTKRDPWKVIVEASYGTRSLLNSSRLIAETTLPLKASIESPTCNPAPKASDGFGTWSTMTSRGWAAFPESGGSCRARRGRNYPPTKAVAVATGLQRAFGEIRLGAIARSSLHVPANPRSAGAFPRGEVRNRFSVRLRSSSRPGTDRSSSFPVLAWRRRR